MQKEIDQLEDLLAEVDYLLNEGVVASQSERERLVSLAERLVETVRCFSTAKDLQL